ncbi:hypothetical protein C0J52_14640 [Blattella germanica]|nr:hypothetical protein C0J52_14640 [Blattella germanica]
MLFVRQTSQEFVSREPIRKHQDLGSKYTTYPDTAHKCHKNHELLSQLFLCLHPRLLGY